MADSGPGPGRSSLGAVGGPQAEQRPGLLMGRPFGIPVFVSPTWFVVAIVITVMFESSVSGAPDQAGVVGRPLSYLVAFTYAVLLYGSVLVHELSHSVVARLFGLPVRAITLHILGGFSEIEREPRTPGREFCVAFAGPFVSLLLGGAGWLSLAVTSPPPVLRLLIEALTVANVVVGLFNLLPGLPLDGGRIIRAGIWKLTGRPRTGTVVAAWSGRVVAVAVVLLGAAATASATGSGGYPWMSLLWAVLVASFIWVGAGQALQIMNVRERIPSLHARRLARRATLVDERLPLAEAIRRAREAGAGALVVVDGEGRPTGVVSEQAVLATPEHRRPWIEVSGLARSLEPDLVLPADISGEDLVGAIRRNPASEYLLLESGGDVFGVLSAEDLRRAFAGA